MKNITRQSTFGGQVSPTTTPRQNVTPNLQTYNPVRVYSDQELAYLMKKDPSFMAMDANNYKDRAYVRSMCEIYCLIAQNTMEAPSKIQHFKISDLETALLKLASEHPSAYKNICQSYGLDLKKKQAKAKHSKPKPGHAELVPICNWGYVDLFLPNIHETIEKIARKMHSRVPMSDIEKAKYAHAFFLFLYTFDLMPYDLIRFQQLQLKESRQNKKLTPADNISLLYKVMCEMYEQEKTSIFSAIVLNSAYQTFFSRMPDSSISIDMIRLYIDGMLNTLDSLRIKEFFGLLTPSEAQDFKTLSIKTIKRNDEIRAMKERLFPFGGWSTDIRLFLTGNDEKFNQAIKAAWNKFERNSYQFGQNVEGYKKAPVLAHVTSEKSTYTARGYLYAKSPLRIRISDEDELWMMRYYLRNL